MGNEGFIDRVKGWWNSFSYEGRPDYVLACKMKALKNKLKEWSKSEQGNLGSQRNTLLRNLAALETIAGIRMLTHEETTNKGELLLEYEHLIKKEEISWRQRSRALWLKEGDRYTKFFHKVPDVNKKYNSIDQLCVKEK